MKLNPINEKGYKLLHDGALALGVAEQNGIRIDVHHLEKTYQKLEAEEKRFEKKILKSKGGKLWKKTYGDSLRFGGLEQLRFVLRECYDIDVKGTLDKGVLGKIDNPFVKDILELRKLVKAKSTYVLGILNEVIDGYIYPNFNLHTTVTYRSSSSSPNFQNIPVRDPWVSELVRSAFIPRKGNRIVEADYSGIEVRVAACYHKDPTMLQYLNTNYDMHKEMAAEVYKIPLKLVTKQIRNIVKNKFVFPMFYGSYHKLIAPDLWEAVTEQTIETSDGKNLLSELKYQKIGTFSSFLEHIKRIEDKFWFDRFPVYQNWRTEWWETYQKKFYFDTYTGFSCRGYMKKNEVINFPIQGSAFHCLLWSFINLTKALRKRKMKTKLIGQIHDSIVADVPENEFEEYIDILTEISTKKIREYWDWIILPLEIEIEASDVNESWFNKKVIHR
jgi:DNA polymerase-1